MLWYAPGRLCRTSPNSKAEWLVSLLQSYFIFSIGNITPIFQTTYKDCYKQYKTCPQSLVNAETYIQVLLAAPLPLPSCASENMYMSACLCQSSAVSCC